MGLLRVLKDSVGGMLQDQWREYFVCDALPADVLLCRGQKRQNGRSSNRGDDNVISNGSLISVAVGQGMLITDQGKIVDYSDEPGEYVYDTGTQASLFFSGAKLGTRISESFKNAVNRYGFAGDPGTEQRVYYFNLKEIMGNKYGTPNPVPFKIKDDTIGLNMVMPIRCFGEYTYKIVNPILFFTNVAGNVVGAFERTTNDFEAQLKSELLTALQPALATISAKGIEYSDLPLHTMEMADALNEVLTKRWFDTRGIEIASFGISSVTASDEDVAKLQQMQSTAIYRDPTMAAANLAAAQAQAMRDAANNPNAGPMMAFAGLNMANMAGGMNSGDLFAMGKQQGMANAQATPNAPATPAEPVSPQTTTVAASQVPPVTPSVDNWTCGTCGATCSGKFCPECGAKKISSIFKCDKCGFVPPNQQNPPKFCPECGDAFTEADKA